MRASPLATILSLAVILTGLGWPTVSAGAGILDMYRAIDELPPAGQGQYAGQSQSPEPTGIFCGGLSEFTELCNPGDGGPCWIISADGVVLQRSTTRSQLLFTNRIGTTDTDPINSKFMDFALAFGPNLSVIRRGPCGWDLEVAYFQIDGFSAQAAVPGQSFMVTDVSGGSFVTDAQARYTSALYSGEVNLRRQWTDWLNLLVGFRVGELNEHYRANGVFTFAPADVALNVNASNHLYGLQVGADAEVYNMGGPLLVNAICKAGIYVNSASQTNHRMANSIVDPSLNVDQSLTSERNQATFLGEIGVVARYALTKHLALRASAQAAWLNGVALAPEQIAETNFGASSARVDTGGSLLYCGGGMGCELRY